MKEPISVQLVPVGSDELPSHAGNVCAAGLFRRVNSWDDSALEIRWNSTDRVFSVTFRGGGPVELPLEDMLSKDVPLQIARSSRCECGSLLGLGDYRIVTTGDDFLFEGEFFCPACKARRVAETSGFRGIIRKWGVGLKKIEIKVDGVGLERE
jgi:hypothetical protein